MGFSDKLRDALGGHGVRLEGRLDEDAVPAGNTVRGAVTARAGEQDARVEAVVVRLVRADRRWQGPDGAEVPEADALALIDRSHLKVRWEQHVVLERAIPVGEDLAAGADLEVPFEFPLGTDTAPSAPNLVYTINVQADVPGQIDPTTNLRLVVT